MLVVPVSCVSQGGFEQTSCVTLPVCPALTLEKHWVDVLVVPVSWVSHGGLEHTCVSPVSASVVLVVLCVSHGGFKHTGDSRSSHTPVEDLVFSEEEEL